MAFSVEMPELGESVTEGTITQWLKSVGDRVEVDEPLLEVSTDKVDTEVPSPHAGVLLEIKAEEDDTVEIGGVIAVIGDPSEMPAATPEPTPAAPASAAPAAPAEATSASADTGTAVTMPELGESVAEGTITQWLKEPGEDVEEGEPLLEVSTDKVDTEIPAPVSGTLLSIKAEEDDTVEVGSVIAYIGDRAAFAAAQETPAPAPEAAPAAPAAPTPEPTPAPAAPASPAPAAETAPTTGKNLPYVTPLVRKLAAQHGVDLSTLTGTGVGGRIRKQDVLDAAAAAAAPAQPATTATTPAPAAPAEPTDPRSTVGVDPEKAALRGTVQKASRIRQITAQKTVEALQIAAQLTQLHEVDMTRVAALRAANKVAFKQRYGANLTFLPFFVKAVAEALVAHPNVNASYNKETKEITYHADVNIAIAVDTPAGLLTPVIHKAQDKTLPELAQAIADVAERARTNKLKPADLAGGTFTITNFGSVGALSDTPILVPPQSGILGTGAIVKRPVVIKADGGEAVAIRSMVYLPLTYDHQIIDGADAGRFMMTVRDRLETANFVGDLGLDA